MPYNILVNKEKGHEAYLNGVAKIRTDHRDGGYCYWVPEGSGRGKRNDVTFYDYDGAIVASYSADDFLDLSSMPDNPSHEELIAQGWNWSLSDAKEYVRKYRMLNIGQMYITTDGKTHIHIHLEKGRTSPMLGVCPNGTVDVDWGDGTAHDTLVGSSETAVRWTPNHAYAAPGDYVIKLTVSGSMGFYGINSPIDGSGLLRYNNANDGRNPVYRGAIVSIAIGTGVTNIRNYAFFDCNSLVSVTIPEGVTSIGSQAFYNCDGLTSITIPDGVTSIGNYMFYYCYSLASVTIPKSVMSIGVQVFWDCHSLTSIALPEGITRIGPQAFSNCYSLASIAIPGSLTSIESQMFSGCINLMTIVIAEGVTSIGNLAFSNCHSLPSIALPEGIMSIGSQAFASCYRLTSVSIPESVMNIGSQLFYVCTGLGEIHFYSFTPPSCSTNDFISIPTDCIIYVPHGSLSAYTSAANYPDPTVYTYVEE